MAAGMGPDSPTRTKARKSNFVREKITAGKKMLFLSGWYAKKRVSSERGASKTRASAQQPPNDRPVGASRGRIKDFFHV